MIGTLYIGTTIAGMTMYVISSQAIISRLKRENYEVVKNKKSKAESIVDLTKVLCLMLTPGLNLLLGLVSVFSFEELYEKTKKSMLSAGKLIKKKDFDEEKENVDIDLVSKDLNNPKRYTELTNEQKLAILEAEKARLLQEKDNKAKTEPYNYKGAYRK